MTNFWNNLTEIERYVVLCRLVAEEKARKAK